MADITKIHPGAATRRTHFIPEWAKRRGKRQVDVVRALNVDKSVVSRWFKSQVVPEWANLVLLAEFFELEDPSSLFRDPEDDWMTRLFSRNRPEALRLRDVLVERSPDELQRIIAVLENAFPRDGTGG